MPRKKHNAFSGTIALLIILFVIIMTISSTCSKKSSNDKYDNKNTELKMKIRGMKD